MENFFAIFPHNGKNVSTPWKTRFTLRLDPQNIPAYIHRTCRKPIPFCCECAGGCRELAFARLYFDWLTNWDCEDGFKMILRAQNWLSAEEQKTWSPSAQSCLNAFQPLRTFNMSKNSPLPPTSLLDLKSGPAPKPPACAWRAFYRIWRLAPIAFATSKIPKIGAFAIPSPIARIAVHAIA